MDIVSHALIGSAIVATTKPQRKWMLFGALFGALPDILQSPNYLYLGFLKGRALWVPHWEDWVGFRDAHPYATLLHDIPHSLFFVIVLATFVYWRKWPWVLLVAFASHIVVDIPTHTNEWATMPLYPIPWRISGITDAWVWPWWAWASTWVFLLVCIFFGAWLRKKRKADRIVG